MEKWLNTTLLVVSIIVGLITIGVVLVRTGAALQWQRDHEKHDDQRFEAVAERMRQIERRA